MAEEHGWWVYILRCADGTLYTGMAADVERRMRIHSAGRGAKYTRSRLPVELVYREACASRSEALRREAAIKGLRRAEKLALIDGLRGFPPSDVGAADGRGQSPE